ncbi:MAG: hypothetical protein KKI08_11975 [Armatimonadetes bacterium]|nr:hypothetical protein [Armatimonadota bacterium]
MTLPFDTACNAVTVAWRQGLPPGEAPKVGDRVYPLEDEDLLALSKDLCKDEIRVLPEAPELAHYNVRSAVALSCSPETRAYCVDAMLRTCVGYFLPLYQHTTRLIECLNTIESGTLGQLEYDACLQTAMCRELGQTEGERDEAVDLYRRAAECAIRLANKTEGDRLLYKAHALSKAAAVMYKLGDRRSAAKLVSEAVDMVRRAEGANAEVDWVLPSVLQTSAGLFAAEGRLIPAAEQQEEAVSLLRKQADPPSAVLASALATLGDYLQRKGLKDRARGALQESLSIAEACAEDSPSGPLFASVVRRQLVALLRTMGETKEVRRLLADTLRDEGVECASLSGDEAAGELWKTILAAHQGEPLLVSDRTATPVEWRKLLILLNADADLLTQLAAERAKLSDGYMREIETEGESFGRLLGAELEDRFARFCLAVLGLQALAHQICDRTYAEDGSRTWRFTNIQVEQVNALVDTVRQGRRGQLVVQVPGEDFEGGTRQQEHVSTADLYLALDHPLEPVEPNDLLIADCFALLTSELTSDHAALRKCRMPRSWAAYERWFADPAHPRPPSCGRFYYSERHALNCRRKCCKGIQTPMEQQEMWPPELAPLLAEREQSKRKRSKRKRS